MSQSSKKNSVLGLGGAGVRILKRFEEIRGEVPLHPLAYDTDKDALDTLKLPDEQKLLADFEWRAGHGCGGNMYDGQRSASRARPRIASLIAGSDLLLVVGGLGGGTASGAAGIVASVAHQADIPVIFLLVLPFSMEGPRKRKLAEDVIDHEIRPVTDSLLLLPNDLLFSTLPADTALDQAFRCADDAVAHALLALGMMLTGTNLLPVDHTLFAELLRERKNLCAIGFGFADENDPPEIRSERALERLFDAPLLGGVSQLQRADSVIISLVGSSDLDIGAAKLMLEQISERINPTANILVGLGAVLPGAAKRMVCAIAIRHDLREQVEAIQPEPRKKSSRKAAAIEEDEDGMLPGILVDTSITAGIFINSSSVMYKSENLDIPTFHRKSIIIRADV